MSTPLPEQPIERLHDRLARLPLRERKKLKTRRAIQHHALRLFDAQGYDATTVEQIADAAEISPSTFFRYFPTKEDVVITDEWDPIMAEVLRGQPPGLSAIEALRATFRELFPQMFELDLEAITIRVRLTATEPALRARTFISLREGTHAVLREILAERVGRPEDDSDVETFTWAVLGVLQSAMYAWVAAYPALDLSELVDHNLEFLGAGCPL
ncbi:TetR family transcriptional regulator [Actinomadura xylanilytica]|uniref:acyl-CoA-like ligand-binding transcription factor n=1 Tax=Actinomadura xylanilytica TaxID=887459 RepID=UPI00255AAD64|nr:TetR family transcriptional regulator [Actinomadura xylanilytica]MDL4772268.1 TetR family transcriptional regulator [Actinomadura xylanilytica]